MLFLSHNSTSIKKFLKGVNELDISRLVVLIQDLINRINEGQAKVTNLGDICLPSSINKSEINALMANAATKLMDELQNPSTEKSLNEEIEKLRHFSSHLMECDNTNCKEQLTSLLSIAPQVVAHLSALDNRSSLNPSKIMELCQLISNATTDKSKSKEFKEGTMNLYELINSICQTLQAFDDQDPYKSASKLY
ncbi:hypothetical protein TVAG_094330 [Trichomonas vaginalis G3]|uniref:Uncharacterized protein n=1 Tax=Trichomonas vaginalis (strain ATCC PRA-98 / G3) TaxID=412133 RepID=A2DBQ5_TRIV3|nr:hypothetical protein TVAGG3_0380970 [Trichomonas vaginalis G3]EAY22258.1 hypothetical protein TVAG_094330 [Trichomonas vaginalis G3]KAI5533271.1 hypothetical protein TVAGG3_0380970 [Trichomonas vaginalis G3]|eukprot:XP_001583244.1 hypothetical protein [Trichomonas vaginalis G3]